MRLYVIHSHIHTNVRANMPWLACCVYGMLYPVLQFFQASMKKGKSHYQGVSVSARAIFLPACNYVQHTPGFRVSSAPTTGSLSANGFSRREMPLAGEETRETITRVLATMPLGGMCTECVRDPPTNNSSTLYASFFSLSRRRGSGVIGWQ